MATPSTVKATIFATIRIPGREPIHLGHRRDGIDNFPVTGPLSHSTTDDDILDRQSVIRNAEDRFDFGAVSTFGEFSFLFLHVQQARLDVGFQDTTTDHAWIQVPAGGCIILWGNDNHLNEWTQVRVNERNGRRGRFRVWAVK